MNERKKQYEVLKWAFSFLQNHGREQKIAEILLQHYLGISRAEFFASMQEEMPDSIQEQFKNDIRKHAFTGIPVQHLTGYEYFYGRKFLVNQHVLIPRFETEELVEHVISVVSKQFINESIKIIDVGTGSGVIAVTLALELPNATIYATDISEEALKVATKNSEKHKASVQFMKGDFLQPIVDLNIDPHIIVSNPPYIDEKKEKQFLADTVKNFDPEVALYADHHGLSAYQNILSQIQLLPKNEKRYICFEIGHTQSEEVTAMLEENLSLLEIKTLKDLNGKDRIISAHY